MKRLPLYPEATERELMNQYYGTFSLAEGWGYLLTLVALGLVLLLLARGMYKKRNLECAGDFSAVRWMEPVLQLAITILGGGGIQLLMSVFVGTGEEEGYVVLFLGMLAAWFAGKMLIKRTSRVFSVQSWAGLGLVTALVALSLYVTALDPLGVAQWVPKQEEVESLRLNAGWRGDVTLDTPEEIEDALRFHLLCAEEALTREQINAVQADVPTREERKASHLVMTYTLKNGGTAQREYYFWVDSEQGEIGRAFQSSVEAVFSQYETIEDAQALLARVTDPVDIRVESLSLPRNM